MSEPTQPSEQTSIMELELNPLKLKEWVVNLDRCYHGLMKKDTDYGTIPGTPKPTLYKPGAEILGLFTNLRPETDIMFKVEDLEGPYFDYTVKVSLWSRKFGFKVGDGVGSANTMESRYAFRWMWSNEVPPDFDKNQAVKRTVKTGSVQYRRNTTPDEIYTLKNTVLKMAEKRAFVDAILRCTGACYSSDTEVMTKKGWKLFSQVMFEDEVATRRDDGVIEFHKPIEKQEYNFNGNMIAFGGKFRSRVDLLVTPNHRMLVRDWKNEISFKQASEVLQETKTRLGEDIHFKIVRTSAWIGEDMAEFEIPASTTHQKRLQSVKTYEQVVELYSKGYSQASIVRQLEGVSSSKVSNWLSGNMNPATLLHQGSPKKVPIDQGLMLLGWYISEGNLRPEGIDISQSQTVNPQKVNAIRDLAKTMGYNTSYIGHAIRICGVNLRDYFKQFGHCDEKFIPYWIKQLPSYRLRVLIDTLLQGDGTVNYRRSGLRYAKYTTTSRRLADDVQEIAIKAGYSSTICTTKRGSGHVMGRPVKQFRTVYDVTIVMQRDTTINRSAVREVPYQGKVYCVTVPNHTLLVRRNGKYAWCGNSRIFTQDIEDTTADVEVEEEEKPTVKIPNMSPVAKPPPSSKPVTSHPDTAIPATAKQVLEHKIQFFLDGTQVNLPVNKSNEGRIKFLREVFAAKQNEYGITIREVLDSTGNIRELETDDIPEKIFEELERNITWALTGSLNVDVSKIAVRVVK